MTKTEIYAEVLTALSALENTEAAKYWQSCLSKENRTGKSIRKSVVFSNDVATVLYALKIDLERDMQAEQAKKTGRKNYSAVSRFMKKCHDRYLFSKPALSVAHERDGRFFLCTPYVFYLSKHSEGLIFAPEDRKEELEKDIDGLYDNIANHFDTNGTAYKIPYTIAQLKAWKKSNGRLKIPFSVGYALPLTQQGEQHIKGPDFPTGGIVMGKSGIRAAYGTGRGKITLRSRTHFEEIQGRNCIIVDEIPYMIKKTLILKNINQLCKDKRIEGIYDLRDESDKDGMRIVIELKKDANPQIILNKLFAMTKLQDTVGIIMLALVNGEPKILTLKQMLQNYLDFQVEVIQRRTRFELRKALERAHILQGFILAADHIDEVISIIRSSKTIPEAKNAMIERFADIDLAELLDRTQYDMKGLHLEHIQGLSQEQAEAIVQMKLGALTGLERQKITDELYELLKKISDYEDILADVNRVYQIIMDDLNVIRKKFSDSRRTDIESISGEVDIEDLIPKEDCVVTFTNNGYIKRMPLSEYKTQHRGGRGITGMKQREEDFVEEMFICGSHDNILFISNKGIMYKLKCYEVPDGSKASRGFNLINLLPLTENEKIAAMIKTTDFSDEKYIVMVTKNGKIKRSNLSLYKNVRKKGLIAIGLDEGDEIAGVRMTEGNARIFAATRNGMAICIEENDVRSMSRSSHGVKAITLREDDYVVSIARVREGASLLTVTENGYGKRTELENYRVQRRGGYGLANYKVDDIRGHVCGIKIVDEDDDIILISSDGVIIRILAKDIRITGRTAKGVRVMRVGEGAKVVAFTRAEHDDDAQTEKVEQLTEEQAKLQDEQAELDEQNEVITESEENEE